MGHLLTALQFTKRQLQILPLELQLMPVAFCRIQTPVTLRVLNGKHCKSGLAQIVEKKRGALYPASFHLHEKLIVAILVPGFRK